MVAEFSLRGAPDTVQIGDDCAHARANRQHYARLRSLAALSRRGRLNARRATARERAGLDMIWRQYRHYRDLELFLDGALHRSSGAPTP